MEFSMKALETMINEGKTKKEVLRYFEMENVTILKLKLKSVSENDNEFTKRIFEKLNKNSIALAYKLAPSCKSMSVLEKEMGEYKNYFWTAFKSFCPTEQFNEIKALIGSDVKNKSKAKSKRKINQKGKSSVKKVDVTKKESIKESNSKTYFPTFDILLSKDLEAFLNLNGKKLIPSILIEELINNIEENNFSANSSFSFYSTIENKDESISIVNIPFISEKKEESLLDFVLGYVIHYKNTHPKEEVHIVTRYKNTILMALRYNINVSTFINGEFKQLFKTKEISKTLPMYIFDTCTIWKEEMTEIAPTLKDFFLENANSTKCILSCVLEELPAKKFEELLPFFASENVVFINTPSIYEQGFKNHDKIIFCSMLELIKSYSNVTFVSRDKRFLTYCLMYDINSINLDAFLRRISN